MRFGLPIHPYAVAMIVSALVSLLLGVRSWFGTKRDISRSFAFFQTTIFLWSVFRLVLWEMPSPEGKFEALKLQYLGIAFLPAAFFMFGRAIAKRPARGLHVILILLPGIAVIVLIGTNHIHHAFWTGDPLSVLPVNPEGGWAFWVFIAYAYIHVALASRMMIMFALRSKGMIARWMRHLIALLALPLATNAAFVFLFFYRTAYDPTPIVFALSGLIVANSLRHFDLLDIVPYAKSVILQSIDTPILAIDGEGFVVGATDESMRLFPDPDALEGRHASEVIPVLSEDWVDGQEREWSAGGVDYLVSSYRVLQKERKAWRGRLFLFRDITALAKARRELEGARAAADAANAAKSAFVAVISHELRNPLNAIIGLADLNLRGGPSPGGPTPELRDDLEVILSSGNILLGLVNDLLDLSKIEAGKMELESFDFDLHEKAVAMLKSFRPAVDGKGLFLDIVVEEGTPRFVRGDPLRYGQVLMNLVSNAVKFTERGAVAVHISSSSYSSQTTLESDAGGEDPRSLCIRTTVRDSGMGIAQDNIPRLFQDFSQVDPSVARRFGGTGLGLSISKRLVALLGGEISVESTEGRGSTFSFTSRFEPGEEAKAHPLPGTLAAGGRALRILVVDDDPVNCAVARRYLERYGHEAAYAGTGAEALARLGEGEFDLLLLDLGLPDMDGFEACRRIKSETAAGQSGTMAIAAMTARSEYGLRGAIASAGMIDCLPKPLDPAALDALLARVASTDRRLGPHAAATVEASRLPEGEPAAAPPPSAPGAPLVDEEALLDRLEGDSVFMRELLGIFVEEAQGRRDAYAVAVRSRDLGALQRLGHALKGSSLSLCAEPLGAAAAAIEAACVTAKRSGFGLDAPMDPIERDVERLLALLDDTAGTAKAILDSLPRR